MTITGPTPHRPGRSRPVRAAVAILGVALAVTGCGGEPHKAAASHSPSPPPPPPVVHSTGRIVHLNGSLDAARKKALVANVTKTADAWLQAAYIGGEYPRAASTYTPKIFVGWSPGAIAKASKQYGLLSNASISSQISGVKIVSSDIGVDALANHGNVAGVTARVHLVFDTSGEHKARETVAGRLAMTPVGTRWVVFSYDIARNDQVAAPPAPSPSSKPSASHSGGKS